MTTITKEASGQKWPFDKPNGWDRDAARMLALIQLYPMMWLCLHRAKYIEMRIDTRDCAFHMRDRDGKPLSADDICDAIEQLRVQFGDEGDIASREYREGSRPEEPLLSEIARLRKALKAVEEWWLSEGIKHFTGAPYAIFAVREALGSPDQQSGSKSE